MDSLGRREFLKQLDRLARLSAAAWILGAHGPAALAALTPADERRRRIPTPRDPSAARILSLRLLTATPLEELESFYGGRLGLPVEISNDRLLLTAGATEITFVASGDAESAPFYHFAFNIPENKILAARAWQLERSELFITPENLRDPRFPNDVRHFRNWNAHSIFFWDPAGNVVEYIARHDLGNPSEGPFTSRDILYASEIAFVSDDVPRAAADLEAALSLPRYGSASEVFRAVGDERGLLLLFKRGRGIGDTLRGRPAAAEVFETRATIRSSKADTYRFPGAPFEIEVSRSEAS